MSTCSYATLTMHGLSSLWDVISWKSKARYDTASDEYTRIFMPKLFILSSIVMAFSYFNDKLNCMVPSRLHRLKGVVQETCWIQGFYIYHEMHTKLNESSYYGIPVEFEHNGVNNEDKNLDAGVRKHLKALTKAFNIFDLNEGRLCSTVNKAGRKDIACKNMRKRYFLQYQWIPFYVCSLAILYFSPYLVFKLGNTDMMSLLDSVQNGNTTKDVDKIVNNFFNYKVNSKFKMQLIVWFNLASKISFIVINVFGFLLTDFVMDGRFRSYGLNWIEWNKHPNHIANDIIKRSTPKPGEYFLPSVGMCDINEAFTNRRGSYIDKHKVVCEISQNIRYQYNFIILWIFIVAGIVISVLGFVSAVVKHLISLLWIYYPKILNLDPSRFGDVHDQLTLREMEYLDKIKTINMTIYGEVLNELNTSKPHIHNIKKFNGNAGTGMLTFRPNAPPVETPM